MLKKLKTKIVKIKQILLLSMLRSLCINTSVFNGKYVNGIYKYITEYKIQQK